jgi:hypothetical protein
MEISPESTARIEARVATLLAEADYAAALQLLEVLFAQPEPAGALVGPYVLCLRACGQKERAAQVATQAVETLGALPGSEYRDQMLALIAVSLRMGEQVAAAAEVASKGAPGALWTGR